MLKYLLTPLLLGLVTPALSAQEDLIETDQRIDQAIEKALKYLADHQNGDGSWSVGSRPHPAITGLALMAFLSAGHVPGEGPYAEHLDKAVKALMKFQKGNGLIATNASREMYHHGIATLALAEVVGMTEGQLAEDIKNRLEKAVIVILKAQRKTKNSYQGGWRYRVAGYDADISVTGWQIMALRAAKNVGCDVPPEAIEEAVKYLERSQDRRSGGYRYTPRGGVTMPCTGTAILALLLMTPEDYAPPEIKKAGSYLLRDLPRWNSGHFCYGIYYCSQATFQLGGFYAEPPDKDDPTKERAKLTNYWKQFKQHLHSTLLQHQRSDGSWNTGGFGPYYSTSMCILAATVEYRFLPIYQRGNEDIEK